MTVNEDLKKLFEEKTAKDEFSGVVLIKQGDIELFSGAYGYANREWKIENTLNTRFRTASITKMFTATAIFQLIDQGKLSLNMSAVNYLELKNTNIPEEVTIEHLLNHTSGIGDYFDEREGSDAWEKLWEKTPIYKVRELKDYLSLFINKESISKPGKEYCYNGAGYILLGLIIEKASGLSYFDYIRENIFKKAGMENSDFLALDEINENNADGYDLIQEADGKVKLKKNIYNTTPEAASDGGASSTAGDLIKFVCAINNNTLISKEMWNEFFAPKANVESAGTYRGFTYKYGHGKGLMFDINGDELIRWGHTGEEYGVSCRLFHYPKTDVTIIVLSNLGGSTGPLIWSIHDSIMEI